MTDVFAEEFDPARDLPKEREILVEGGPAFILKQHDPHGFWRVSRKHGQIPATLDGDYTTFTMADAAVRLYLNTMPKKKDK